MATTGLTSEDASPLSHALDVMGEDDRSDAAWHPFRGRWMKPLVALPCVLWSTLGPKEICGGKEMQDLTLAMHRDIDGEGEISRVSTRNRRTLNR